MRTIGKIIMLAAALTVASLGTAVADPEIPDKHYNYPAQPSGYLGLIATFGQPCNKDAYANTSYWVARDDANMYTIRYHRKLGGASSSNMVDVRNHISTQGYDPKLLSGIWGYSCRYIAGTTKWSVHAWGAAVDLNSRYEHVGSPHYHCHTIPSGLGSIWKTHGWRWGLSWADCMHFQYATNY